VAALNTGPVESQGALFIDVGGELKNSNLGARGEGVDERNTGLERHLEVFFSHRSRSVVDLFKRGN